MSGQNPSRPVPPSVRSLIHKAFDQPLTDSEVAELEHALKTNPDAQAHYGEIALLNADLIARKQAGAICREMHFEFPEDHTETPSLPLRRSRLTQLLDYLPRSAAMLAIGITLGCGVGLLAATITYPPFRAHFESLSWNWEVSNEVIAKIESTHDVVWQVMENPVTPRTRGLRIGDEVRIDRGQIQLKHRCGTSLILRGPGVYQVRSEQGGKLFSGVLSTSVPPDCAKFRVETPSGKADLGPGHYGIDAENSATKREVTFTAFSGYPEDLVSAKVVSISGRELALKVREAVRLDYEGVVSAAPCPALDRFPTDMPPARVERFTEDKIYLANLFDDCQTSSLTQAMRSDKFQAAAETIDLGVAAVIDGGLDMDVRLAENGVLFNFANVGGGGSAVSGLPANDTYRSNLAIPIRTTGEDLPFSTDKVHHNVLDPTEKIEEGIGISTNELLTFDLDELRRAGQLYRGTMRFVVDRAGINDRELPIETSREKALANLIVIVSSEAGVLSACLNGQEAEVVKHEEVYSLAVDEARASAGMRYDGRFVNFDVSIPPAARFLTLVSASLGPDFHDHVVFSGARLELLHAETVVSE